jgi:hypothetical protein
MEFTNQLSNYSILCLDFFNDGVSPIHQSDFLTGADD